ncbi:hypothetical protein UFOVP59_2 [uncultured Caudovirales phage]|uniref:Uncharacterized protein n=1 Tax=uncultured Caudovirales phage TaxID=2100421 RepID=A0A6J5KU45_9CAUD|nr:hypothetical protein UFOVP59_2 [uncultured Caudovirales phage]CAB5220731.1 hypothetical protein UFOVP246_30 [uncultured Caudovirales phage]
MTSYVAVANGEIDADSPITADLMTKLRDNPIALSEGASGAPKVMAAALNLTANTLTGSVGSGASTTLSLNQYSLFPSVAFGGTTSWGTGTSTIPRLSLSNGSGSSVGYSIWWNSIS